MSKKKAFPRNRYVPVVSVDIGSVAGTAPWSCIHAAIHYSTTTMTQILALSSVLIYL